jgi:S-adenosylmethionine:tRNA ribosyltransferase-isomerase
MVLDREGAAIEHRRFSDLPAYLGGGDLIVVNDSAVSPARILGKKRETGGGVELLLLKETGRGRWRSLVKGRITKGTAIEFADADVKAKVLSVEGGGEAILGFSPADGGRMLMKSIGLPPLPPYIRRAGGDARRRAAVDRVRYQTVYARTEGSVAAPTAGLHFTESLLEKARKRGARTASLTLHVGPGTFRPLRENDLSRAVLEGERVFIPAVTARAVNDTKKVGGRVIAVGTTATRALETSTGEDGRVRGGKRTVDLFIRPGYTFRTVSGLVTNFHLPRSSLLLLVAAFAGRERILGAYREAIDRGYRFYSYGDAMLIL